MVESGSQAGLGNPGDPHFRHGGDSTGNFAFADGHTEALEPERLQVQNVRVQR